MIQENFLTKKITVRLKILLTLELIHDTRIQLDTATLVKRTIFLSQITTLVWDNKRKIYILGFHARI